MITAREVVSRQIKRLTEQGPINTRRGHIEIIDRAALDHLARQD